LSHGTKFVKRLICDVPSRINKRAVATCRCQKATGEALFDIIVGIINHKEDQPNVHLELT